MAAVGHDIAAQRRDDAARDAVVECSEGTADRDDELADLEPVRVADRRRRQARRVDLDDGQVGEGVDAVDLRVVLRAVLELDRQVRGARDDMAVRQDPAVRVEDDPRADAVLLLLRRRVRVDALRVDPDDRRAGLGRDIDDRRRLVERERLLDRGGVGALAGRCGDGRAVECASGGQGRDGPTRGENRRGKGGDDDCAGAGSAVDRRDRGPCADGGGGFEPVLGRRLALRPAWPRPIGPGLGRGCVGRGPGDGLRRTGGRRVRRDGIGGSIDRSPASGFVRLRLVGRRGGRIGHRGRSRVRGRNVRAAMGWRHGIVRDVQPSLRTRGSGAAPRSVKNPPSSRGPTTLLAPIRAMCRRPRGAGRRAASR